MLWFEGTNLNEHKNIAELSTCSLTDESIFVNNTEGAVARQGWPKGDEITATQQVDSSSTASYGAPHNSYFNSSCSIPWKSFGLTKGIILPLLIPLLSMYFLDQCANRSGSCSFPTRPKYFIPVLSLRWYLFPVYAPAYVCGVLPLWDRTVRSYADSSTDIPSLSLPLLSPHSLSLSSWTLLEVNTRLSRLTEGSTREIIHAKSLTYDSLQLRLL